VSICETPNENNQVIEPAPESPMKDRKDEKEEKVQSKAVLLSSESCASSHTSMT